MYDLTKNGFESPHEFNLRTIRTEFITDIFAQSKQDASLTEYEETHGNELYTESIKNLMEQFQRFIGFSLFTHMASNQPIKILDIGCGISPHIPPYFRKLGLNTNLIYVGLDPFEKRPERDYYFINGKFEGLHTHLRTQFDCAVFSTSLDHFEDLEEVSKELKKILINGGLAIFWVGLHDPDIVAKQSLFEYFRDLRILSLVRVVARIVKFPTRILKLHQAMKQRRKMLLQNQPLDKLHFHYFTRSDLDTYINSLGVVIDKAFIEQTNSIFYSVKITPKAEITKS